MPLFASGVAMPKDLTDALASVGTGGTAGINDIYSQAKKRQGQEAMALGRPTGANSYGPQRFGVQQGLDQGNLEATLGGVLGDTGYKNALQEREFQQNKQLAEEAARLNKPSLLQQIFQGIGGVGKTAATYYGMQNRGGGGTGMEYAGGSGELPPNLSLYPGGGASRYYGGGY